MFALSTHLHSCSAAFRWFLMRDEITFYWRLANTIDMHLHARWVSFCHLRWQWPPLRVNVYVCVCVCVCILSACACMGARVCAIHAHMRNWYVSHPLILHYRKVFHFEFIIVLNCRYFHTFFELFRYVIVKSVLISKKRNNIIFSIKEWS